MTFPHGDQRLYFLLQLREDLRTSDCIGLNVARVEPRRISENSTKLRIC
jgi:hypothetical protein